MSELKAEQFSDYFRELYRYEPMGWQQKLANDACNGEWPDYISLPTGAGKTSTIDIALFALAFQSDLPPQQRSAPMRTFLVVDRRTVVNEAFCRASALQDRLATAKSGVLKTVADRLRSYGGTVPVSVVELRGGIYRSPSWCNSLNQPMIVTSTVDQVGSRMLFRGYGVSCAARPMQAAAVAHDSLVILDEAHISMAFSQTLGFIKNYQQEPWSPTSVPLPMRYVEMTATPPEREDAVKLEISSDQLADKTTHIGNIVNTPKLTQLEVAEKVKGAKAPIQLAKVLAERILNYAELESTKSENDDQVNTSDKNAPQVFGVMTNMVATAKETYGLLVKHKKVDPKNVHLVIGAMRPCDRDTQTEQLRKLISTGADRSEIDGPIFVVATQCIEVGADYDFDVLVTEAAPLSALVQRFGRLNRSGRDIDAIGHVVMRGDRVKPDASLDKDELAFNFIDPIYANAMSYSWNWLTRDADTVDFGIAAFKQLADKIDKKHREKMSVADKNAPVLLPAHLDLLCQTSIDPWPNPDVSLWLHGPGRNDPEVQVCWRADIVTANRAVDGITQIAIQHGTDAEQVDTIHAVSLCPPSVAECLSVPLHRVCKWLSSLANLKKTEADTSADIPSMIDGGFPDSHLIPPPLRPLAWRGTQNSEMIADVKSIRPGDTLVFPVTATGWDELGFVPEVHGFTPHDKDKKQVVRALVKASDDQQLKFVECQREDFDRLCSVDRGTQASSAARNRPILRLHPNLVDSPMLCTFLAEMRKPQNGIHKRDVIEFLNVLPRDIVGKLATGPSIAWEVYPNIDGIVVTGPRCSEAEVVLAEDDGTDLYSHLDPGSPIELADHCQRVRGEVERTLDRLPMDHFTKTFLSAAEAHDWGKADPRFQAMLLGGDQYSALWEDRLYAKSAEMPTSLREQQQGRKRANLPSRFRHELLSVSLVESVASNNWDTEDYPLMLHLIATHHGHARPWAPVCEDPDPPAVSLHQIDRDDVTVSKEQRKARSDHAIDSPLIDQFWEMNRRYGWWGIAYLESILRFADQRASRLENMAQKSTKNLGTKLTREQIA